MLQASLKVIGGKNDGKLIEFKARKFLVGREQDCHLRPNSDLVSRHHCVFTIDDYAVRLRDLGSTNGTLVNGRRIRGETVLTPGDVVRIGKLNLEVVIGTPEAAGAEVAPPAANQETSSNASSLDTSFDMPAPQTLDDSGEISSPGDTVSSEDTAQFQASSTPPSDEGSGEALPAESETLAAGATDQTLTDADPSLGQPQQVPPAQPPGDTTTPPWQYPQYPQFAPYPQYPPQGYPGYPPPGYPPGYAYPPQPMGYPPNYQPPASPPPPAENSDSGYEIPEVRLPNPEETGAQEEPQSSEPEQSSEESNESQESTPSQRAADLIKARRRRASD